MARHPIRRIVVSHAMALLGAGWLQPGTAHADEPERGTVSATSTSQRVRLAPPPTPELLPVPALQLVRPFTSGYWRLPWRIPGSPDINPYTVGASFTTGQWQLGPLQLKTSVSVAPVDEAAHEPGASGSARASLSQCDTPGCAVWASEAQLKVRMGDMGPLKDVGPSLRISTQPRTSQGKPGTKALLGLDGKF